MSTNAPRKIPEGLKLSAGHTWRPPPPPPKRIFSEDIYLCSKKKLNRKVNLVLNKISNGSKQEDNMEKIYTRDDGCPFVKGEDVMVCQGEGYQIIKLEFYTFIKELAYPFLCFQTMPTEDEKYVRGFKWAKKLLPDLKVDDKVWVRESGGWLPMHFRRWSKAGHMVCFLSGKTSHSIGQADVVYNEEAWDEYTTEDPNKHDCCKE